MLLQFVFLSFQILQLCIKISMFLRQICRSIENIIFHGRKIKMLIKLLLVDGYIWIHLLQLCLNFFHGHYHLVDLIICFLLFLLHLFQVLFQLLDQKLKLTLISHFTCLFFKTKSLELLLSTLKHLQSHLDLSQKLFDVFFLILILRHIFNCFLILSIIFFDTSRIFQKPKDLELIHKSHLINFTLLHNVVCIWKREPNSFDESFIVSQRITLLLDSELLNTVILPYSLYFVDVGIWRMAGRFATDVQLHCYGLSFTVYPSLNEPTLTWRWELYWFRLSDILSVSANKIAEWWQKYLWRS